MNSIQNNDLILEFKNYGAELTRIFSKKYNKEILWNANPEHWARHSPILFPIVGKLTDNKTTINNSLYSMGQHGFARDIEFNLINKDNNSIEYLLTSNEDTFKLYPYKFKLNILYTLNDSTLNITWKVKNIDNVDMYFSIGAHPAFNLPFDDISTINDYYLSLNANKNIQQFILSGPHVNNKIDIDTVSDIQITPNLFINDAIIYSNINDITINSHKSPLQIKVSFNNFPFVGIWSPYYKESNSIAPFICIEPWYGIADTINSDKVFENKLGINKLAPDEEFLASYQIEIK